MTISKPARASRRRFLQRLINWGLFLSIGSVIGCGSKEKDKKIIQSKPGGLPPRRDPKPK